MIPDNLTPKQLASFSRAVARYARRGFRQVSDAVYGQRRALCDACEQRDPEKDRCRLCKCRLSGLMNKLRMPNQICPAGKWGKEESAS